MYALAKKMKRKFNALSQSNARRSRPAKLKKLTAQIEGIVANTDAPATSAVSQQMQEESSGNQTGEVNADGVPVPQVVLNIENPHRDLRSPDWITVDEEQLEAELSRIEETQEEIPENTSEPQLPPALDPNQAQLLRDQVYYLFEYEDQSDYTEGPCRMADATDGVKACAALLMTLPLSAKIQDAVHAQRDFAKAKRVAANQKLACLRFRSTLNAEIANRKNEIKKKAEDDDPEDDERLGRLEEELRNLELMLEGNRVEEQLIKNDVQNQGDRLLKIQEQAIEEIEDAFVYAGLVPPVDDTPDTPVPDIDLNEEYQKFVNQKNGLGSVCSGPGSESYTSSDGPRSETPTPEAQRREHLKRTVWTAQRRHELAQGSFDRREADRADEYRANGQAFERGEETTDDTPEDFDLRWVHKIQELTREFIEAESALSAAKAAAAEEGVDVPMNDRASGFADDTADGYRMSMEQAMIGSVPSPKIKDWMSGIPEVASPSFNEQTEEADEWEADEVEMSDSVSMVAQDAGERKGIDKWRRVCGLE